MTLYKNTPSEFSFLKKCIICSNFSEHSDKLMKVGFKQTTSVMTMGTFSGETWSKKKAFGDNIVKGSSSKESWVTMG
jgi:hypothetical protein